MNKVFLCPGQGAQAIGMAKAWYDTSAEARQVFAQADSLLAGQLPGNATLSELCFNGPADVLNRTDVSQPAIFTATIACLRGLLATLHLGSIEEAKVIAAAGLSLGEYSALHIAGCFSFADGLSLVALRGQAMQQAAVAVPSGMVALIGADEDKAKAVCAEALAGHSGDVLVCANFNAPGQVVISGSKAACDRVSAAADKVGVKATVLAVAGAFHSPIMAPAAARLQAKLAATNITPPRCTVVSNVTAKPHAAEGGLGLADVIRARLVEQLTAPVRWSESCSWLVATIPATTATYHELAPGKTLTGLFKRIDRNVKIENHDTPATAAPAA